VGRQVIEGDILFKTDRASMANSLEVRSPLLDDRFAAIARQIPMNLKLSGRTGKAIFKKCMQGRLPDEIIHRPKKGFGIPVAHWIRGDLKHHVDFRSVYATVLEDWMKVKPQPILGKSYPKLDFVKSA